MKKYIFMLLLVLVSVGTAFAQDQQSRIEVTGTVTDEQHEPLIGVTVTVKDQVGLGAITNIDGVFKIKIPQYSNIVFSYIGMETQTVFVKTQKTVNVVMKTSKENVLDEVAVTGTGVQKKITLTGAVTTVSASDLKTPTASLSNSFAGVVPGVFARQTTGQPGNNVSEFWIRGISTFGAGSSALVLVDGFERNLNDINTEDIETFTVLKDASATAIYGSRGANGVVLITTKHGKEGKININAKAEYTYSTRTKTPEYVDGVTYAQLLNEARVTRNQQAGYTDDELYVLKNQLDPDIFPNVDWMGLLLRKGAPTYRANVDFSGGGQLARYFVSASYVDEGGMYKTDNALDKYNTNANYHRFNYRMNVDMNLTKTTLLKVGISGSLEKQNQPGFSSDDIWYSLTGYTPVATPVKYSNGRFGAFGNGNRTNPYVMITQSGYNETWNNTVQTTASLEQNLDFVTKGLKFYGRFGFDVYSNSGNKRVKWPEQWIVERLRDADGELLPGEGTIAEFPSRQTVEDVIAHHFTGRIEQVPNSYSAIKINGQRAYDLAREGKDVDLKARPVTISEFSVSAVRYGYASTTCAGSPLADAIEIAPEESWHAETDGQNEPNMQPVMELDVTVTCSAGTYIRALGRDLGSELGLGGHLTMLRRIRVGRFSVDMPNVMTAHTEAKTFTNREGIEVTRNRAVLDDAEHAVDHALDLVASAAASMDMLPVTEQEATDLRFGRRIAHDIHTTMAAYVPETNDLVAIVERAKRGETKPVAVFN